MAQQTTTSPVIDTVYEHPLGERVKLLLKLEAIFSQASDHRLARNQYETQMCLDALFALLNISRRYELRLLMLKELDGVNNMLSRGGSGGSESIDATQKALGHCQTLLHDLNSRHIDLLRNVKFLNTIKLRSIHETGGFLFEIPELRYWLLQDSEQRSQQIQNWMRDFVPFKETTTLLLKLMRESAEPEQVTAPNGIYIKTVDDRCHTKQLLRIHIDEQYHAYPSVSGDNYRFVVRFMQNKQMDTQSEQVQKQVSFHLAACGY